MEIINHQEWAGKLIFKDVGAIVYYLKAVPWLVPDFSVDSHVNYLLQIQERLESDEILIFEVRKYLIEARKEVNGSALLASVKYKPTQN